MVGKITVVSFYKDMIEKELAKYDLKLVKSNPEMVIAFGGDGSLIYSEQAYPGIPKVLVKMDRNKKYKGADFSEILMKIEEGKFKIKNIMKLHALLNGKKEVTGINDVNIHYELPCALRYDVKVGGRNFKGLIGDGLVVATPYGSKAYFESITGKNFKRGIGVAFNNTTVPIKPLIVKKDEAINVKITRGPGVLTCDCNRNLLKLKTKDSIRIHAREDAQVAVIDGKDLRILL